MRIDRHLAAATLQPLEGVDFGHYAGALKVRFANPAIAHETYQIAMDGTEKPSRRILQPALENLQAGRDIRPFAFAVAARMRYCLGRNEDGRAHELRDPREAPIKTVPRDANDAAAISAALSGLPGIFPAQFAASPVRRLAAVRRLDSILKKGVAGIAGTRA